MDDNRSMHELLSKRPLEGVRIMDMTHAYSGPFCTMHLADHGAEVIKLEVPGKGDQSRTWEPIKDGASGYFSCYNRNKYGLALDLKSDEGKRIYKEVIAKVDVVVENFRVGTMEKLGLGYDVLKEINPRLIYASISGFGIEGPDAPRPCYDIVAQALGGIISVTGFGDDIVKVGPAIADNYSGTYLALGIVMALFQRERTGMGRRLDVSMVDSIFSILEVAPLAYTIKGEISRAIGNRDPGITPFDAFRASDGMFVIACGTDRFFAALCSVMNMPDLPRDPRFVTNSLRCRHEAELKEIIESWSLKHNVADIERQILAAGIPFGNILTPAQACESDIIRRRNMLWKVYDPAFGKEIEIIGAPIKMHGCADAPRKAAPRVGEDTDNILKELINMSDGEIAKLHENGVI